MPIALRTQAPNAHADLLRLRGVQRVLQSYRYRYTDEASLHRAIEEVLVREHYTYLHEHSLDPANRVDFYLEGLVIEVKIDGTFATALRQVDRYCDLDAVTGVLLATTQRWSSSADIPPMLRAKPFAIAQLTRRSL